MFKRSTTASMSKALPCLLLLPFGILVEWTILVICARYDEEVRALQ